VSTGAQEAEKESITVTGRLLGFLILGIVLVFVGIAILVASSIVMGNFSSSAGAVIFIGPIPIVFGSGPNATWLISIGIILAVLSIAISLIMSRRLRRFND
jgi:uncharacterized membrane protein